MQVKILKNAHYAIPLTCIKPPFVINKICVLYIFEWPLKIDFTVTVSVCGHLKIYSRSHVIASFVRGPLFNPR